MHVLQIHVNILVFVKHLLHRSNATVQQLLGTQVRSVRVTWMNAAQEHMLVSMVTV